MTQTFMTDVVPAAPAAIATQKFGRIVAVRPGAEGSKIDIRQPDGALLTACLSPDSIDSGTVAPQIGRNVWVSGRIDGVVMRAGMFAVYAQEL